MCGIAGQLNFNGTPISRAAISHMLDTIVHRGPDDEGIYTAGPVGLGQRRLSIIDLRREASPPLSNEDGTVWIVFNGEIYNFAILREELSQKGHVFRTSSDTEVIVHLYEQYGQDCVQRLRGMFAFAIWDEKKQELLIARDRLGKKPFYYSHTSSMFVFGSEIKAITANPQISRIPNYYAIDQYLSYQYVPSPLTAFAGISKLPPAHILRCTASGTITTERYWAPPKSRITDMSMDAAQANLLEILREAVRLRMVADVPVGAFLSGGIDSGAVVALMALQSARPIKTFSIGFEDDRFNELPFARMVAKRYGTDHHEFIVKPSATELLPNLIKYYNEPFADSSALPTFYVAQLTRRHVKVALSGDGGDETFAGYSHYRAVQQLAAFDWMPSYIRSFLCTLLAVPLKHFSSHEMSIKVGKALDMVAADLPKRYHHYMSIVKDSEKRQLYTDNFAHLLETPDRHAAAWQLPYESNGEQLDWMIRHDQSHYLPDCLMVKTDVASMANSLEVRCPLLDHQLVEYAATLPAHWKRTSNGGGKIILKEAVRQLLPHEIYSKPKTGFAIPLARWFREDLSSLLREVLFSDIAVKRDLFRADCVRRMVNEHIDGQRNWSNRLWALLCLELWFREFID